MPRKIKILFLGKLPPPYIGPSIAAKIITESRLKDKYELIFFDISYHKSLSKFGNSFLRSFFLTFRLIARFSFALIRQKPDMVYIPSQQDTLGYLRDTFLINIAKMFGKKVVCHLRGGYFRKWYDSASWFMRWLVRFTHKKVDAQIVLGEKLKSLYNFLLPDEKIFVVPNGGNYSFPEVKKDESKISVLFLSNFFRSKGILDFVNAAMMADSTVQTEYIIAGESKEEDVEEEIKKLNREHPETNIRLMGKVNSEEKMKLLKSSDIFVFPTWYPFEGHPWVIVEAMAAGLPVISTDHAAITESVLDGVNGYIVEKQNPAILAEKICYLLNNPHTRTEMGERSRQLYEERFTGGIMIDKLDKVFEKVSGT